MAESADQTVHAGARVYAEALLDMASEHDVLDVVVAQAGDLLEVLRSDPSGISRVLDSHMLGVSERAGILERVLQGRVHDIVYRFIQVINRKGRLPDLAAILVAALALYREKQGVAEVSVTLAVEPDDAMRSHLESRLSEALGCGVDLKTDVDPSLLGGMVTRIGDRQIDASVAGRLRRMNHQMIDAGRAAARTAVAEAG